MAIVASVNYVLGVEKIKEGGRGWGQVFGLVLASGGQTMSNIPALPCFGCSNIPFQLKPGSKGGRRRKPGIEGKGHVSGLVFTARLTKRNLFMIANDSMQIDLILVLSMPLLLTLPF